MQQQRDVQIWATEMNQSVSLYMGKIGDMSIVYIFIKVQNAKLREKSLYSMNEEKINKIWSVYI